MVLVTSGSRPISGSMPPLAALSTSSTVYCSRAEPPGLPSCSSPVGEPSVCSCSPARAVGNVFQHVQPADAVGLQVIDGVGILLLEEGRQNVAHFHLLLARGLHLHDGALQDALYTERLHDFGRTVLGQGFHVFVEKALQLMLEAYDVDTAMHQDVNGLIPQGAWQRADAPESGIP